MFEPLLGLLGLASRPPREVYENMMADVEAIGWPIYRDRESGRFEIDGLAAEGAAILHCRIYAEETQGRLRSLFEIRALISAIDIAGKTPGHVQMDGDTLRFPHFRPVEKALVEQHRSHQDVKVQLDALRQMIEDDFQEASRAQFQSGSQKSWTK